VTKKDRNLPRKASLKELSAVRERIGENLSEVKSLAEHQFHELSSPLPDGFDYFPSSFFLLVCRAMGVESGSAVPIACAMETLSMAFRALIMLTAGGDRNISAEPDHQHEEGMSLLLVDGFIVLSHKFLAELEEKEFRTFAPLLAEHISELTDLIHQGEDISERFVKVQRSLSEMAVNTAVELAEEDDEMIKVIEDLLIRIDHLLTGFRASENEEERKAFEGKFSELSRSFSQRGELFAPIVDYISLVRGGLNVIS
jgi:hypothetical protein